MGAHGELELEDEFVGGAALAIPVTAELRTDQAELARQIGEEHAAAGILQQGPVREVGRLKNRKLAAG